jgi:hypothetical protein
MLCVGGSNPLWRSHSRPRPLGSVITRLQEQKMKELSIFKKWEKIKALEEKLQKQTPPPVPPQFKKENKK